MTARDAQDVRYWPAEKADVALGALPVMVYGVPAPQGSKRHVGNGVMVESSKAVKPWREAVKWAALDAAARIDGSRVHFPGPVALNVTFTFPRPRSHYRTGRNAHLLRDSAPAYPAGKPDLDKILRSTADALGDAGVWRDDAQVVRVVATKVYGPIPGAHIIVREHKP